MDAMETYGISTNCSYEPMPYLELKFVIVGVLGTGVAVVGSFLNGLAFAVLKRFVFENHSPLIYLSILALFDFLFMVIYILAISMQVFYDFYHNLVLYLMWNKYISYVMTVGKINQTASTYLLVVATVERMMDVGVLGCGHIELKNQHRAAVVLGVILFAMAFRIASLWELKIVLMAGCSGFASFSLEQNEISLTRSYQIYNFYVVNIVQAYLPFAFLVIANFWIVQTVRNSLNRQGGAFRRDSAWKSSDERKNLRTAANVLVTVVTMYLAANLLNVVISVIEYTNQDLLLSNPYFYTFSVDCIGLMQVATSACRLIISILLSEKLRTILLNMLGIGMIPVRPEVFPDSVHNFAALDDLANVTESFETDAEVLL